jgi:AraC family transcriptional regulator
VVRHLLSSLRPLIAEPEQAHPLFLDHVALAMTAHMACAFAGLKKDAAMPRGGLTPGHERRAKEFISANLNEAFSLSRLAEECGLSTQHFARAFRISTGMPPHRFLVRQRLERAQELLRTRALSLVDVAIFSGFADQSHFNRVFKTAVGVTPGTWRSMNTVRTP